MSSWFSDAAAPGLAPATASGVAPATASGVAPATASGVAPAGVAPAGGATATLEGSHQTAMTTHCDLYDGLMDADFVRELVEARQGEPLVHSSSSAPRARPSCDPGQVIKQRSRGGGWRRERGGGARGRARGRGGLELLAAPQTQQTDPETFALIAQQQQAAFYSFAAMQQQYSMMTVQLDGLRQHVETERQVLESLINGRCAIEKECQEKESRLKQMEEDVTNRELFLTEREFVCDTWMQELSEREAFLGSTLAKGSYSSSPPVQIPTRSTTRRSKRRIDEGLAIPASDDELEESEKRDIDGSSSRVVFVPSKKKLVFRFCVFCKSYVRASRCTARCVVCLRLLAMSSFSARLLAEKKVRSEMRVVAVKTESLFQYDDVELRRFLRSRIYRVKNLPQSLFYGTYEIEVRTDHNILVCFLTQSFKNG